MQYEKKWFQPESGNTWAEYDNGRKGSILKMIIKNQDFLKKKSNY